MALSGVTTGVIGQSIVLSGQGYSAVNKVFFSQQPEHESSAPFSILSPNLIEATIPVNSQFGPITVASDLINSSGESSFDFVPKPEIISVSNFNPLPNTVINVSGLGLSGVTGAYFGDNEVTGYTRTGDITNIQSLPIEVPTGNISGVLKIVGQSGLSDSVSGIGIGARITGISPTSGIIGSQVTLSGENFIPQALKRVSEDNTNPDYNVFEVSFNGGVTGFGYPTLSSGAGVLTGFVPANAVSGNVNLIASNGVPHTGGIDFNLKIGPPVINSLTPQSGIPAGNSNVSFYDVKGKNFSSVTGIYAYKNGSTFDIDSADNLLSPQTISYDNVSGTDLTISSPSGTGYMNLVVQTSHGTGQSEGAFFAKYKPEVIGFTPSIGRINEGVTITGSGFFTDDLKVFFSGESDVAHLSRKIPATISGVVGDPRTEQQTMTVQIPGLSSSASYRLLVENGVATGGMSEGSFSFLGAPTINSVTPESGSHGDIVVISGTSLAGVTSLKHGSVPVTTYSEINPFNPTGLSFTVPAKSSYLTYDNLFRNRYESLTLTTPNGTAYYSGKFLTIPDDVVCSGFYPAFEQRGGTITITGGNLEVVTGVHFSGTSSSAPTVVRVQNDGFTTQILPTGSSPKTGIMVRVPGDATSGPLKLVTEYSSCTTSDTFSIDAAPTNVTVNPSTGIYAETVYLRGNDLHNSKFYLYPGYTGGSLDLDNPVIGNSTLNTNPVRAFVEPTNTQYLTSGDGEQYVTFEIPRGLPDQVSIYTTRKEVTSPSAGDYRPIGAKLYIWPVITGISHTEIRVGDTLYVTGVNAFNTFENSIGISGTGVGANHEPSSYKELEFLSNYNTKVSFFEDGSDASWFNLGDIFIPNQPQTLIGNNDPQAHKYNAEIRRDHFQSGIANVDETGVYVFPITVGDNFVGTGQLFFFLNEPDLLHTYRTHVVEAGPDSAGGQQGRLFSNIDVNSDGIIDPFFWSGKTTGTAYQHKGHFYSGFTGSFTSKKFEDIRFKGHELVILPELIDISGISTLSGFPNQSLFIEGTGLTNITGVDLVVSGGTISGGAEYPITISSTSSTGIEAVIPSVSFSHGNSQESGTIKISSNYSETSSQDVQGGSGHLIVSRPPEITGFFPSVGIQGETIFAVGGINLEYANTLQIDSQDTDDLITLTTSFTGLSNGTTGISGLTPTDILPLPQNFNFKLTSPYSTDQIGTFKIVEGDLDVYGNLRVHESAFVQDKLVSSGNTFVHGDIDVSGEYLLDGVPFEADTLVKGLPRKNKILHLDASNEASYSGAGSSWVDVSKSKNTATLVNSPTFSINELQFNGSDQYATMPMSEDLKAQDFTIGILFNPKEAGGTIATPIFEAPNLVPTELVSFQISYDSSRRFFSTLTFTDLSSSTVFTNPVDTGQYHLVNSTWDGSTHKIYISGEEASSESVGPKTISYTDQQINILSNTAAARFVEGNLRDIHMFSGAKSSEDILEIYENLTRATLLDRDLIISGGKIISYEKDDTSKSAVIENNFITLTGDGAGININGHSVDPTTDTYNFENVSIGNHLGFTGVQGTATSNTLTSTDTLVGSIALNLPPSSVWEHVKVHFTTFLQTADNLQDVKVKIGSDEMDWPIVTTAQVETTNSESDNILASYVTEGYPSAHNGDSPLNLDVYAKLGSTHSDDDVASRRSLYAVGTFNSGSGAASFEITTHGNASLTFQPNTGIGSVIGTAIYTGNGDQDSFLMEYTENNVEHVFVSLDGIELSPSIDYVLSGTTGVKIASAPSVGEEVLIRQISDSVVAQPTEYNITIPMEGSGSLNFTDLSTGTNITFSGDISGLNVDNYNIYDSNVSITGGGQSIYNQFTGIDVSIDNNAAATAVNVYTEPGGDSSVTSTNSNVVVANEGTINYITNNSETFVYAETGAGKVHVTGGSNQITGIVHITGGTNSVSGTDVRIYESTNDVFFLAGYTGTASVTGANVTVTNSGTIPTLSGQTLTITDSQVSNFGYSGTGITIQGNSTANITGLASGVHVTQNNGTANYIFSGAMSDSGSIKVPHFHAYRSGSDLTVAQNKYEIVEFNHERSGDNYITGYDESNFRFIAQESGKYFLSASIYCGKIVVGDFVEVQIHKNATSIDGTTSSTQHNSELASNRVYNTDDVSSYYLQPEVSSVVDALPGDYFEVFAITDSSSNRKIKDEPHRSFFFGYKIDPMSINTQEYSNTITANASFTAQGYGQTQFNITGDDATITDSENVDVFTSNVTVNNSTGINITGNSIDSISITGSSQTTNIDLNSGDLSFTGNANSTNVISGANTVQATGTNYYIYYSTVYLTGAAS